MRVGAVLIAAAFLTCSPRPHVVSIRVVSAEKDAVIVEIRNDMPRDIVLLSPESPSRQFDERHCTITLSTKVEEYLQPFAFTPRLVTVPSGAAREFRAAIYPYRLIAPCPRWIVNAAYAYIRPEDARRFAGAFSEEFRRHVLRNQQLVTTTASVNVKPGS